MCIFSLQAKFTFPTTRAALRSPKSMSLELLGNISRFVISRLLGLQASQVYGFVARSTIYGSNRMQRSWHRVPQLFRFLFLQISTSKSLGDSARTSDLWVFQQKSKWLIQKAISTDQSERNSFVVPFYGLVLSVT